MADGARRLWLEDLGFGLDTGRLVPENWETTMGSRALAALEALKALEAGTVANGTERRQVGHYWLRAPELAPSEEIRQAIEETLQRIQTFATAVLEGKITAGGRKFSHLLCIGIGGSILGTQLLPTKKTRSLNKQH